MSCYTNLPLCCNLPFYSIMMYVQAAVRYTINNDYDSNISTLSSVSSSSPPLLITCIIHILPIHSTPLHSTSQITNPSPLQNIPCLLFFTAPELDDPSAPSPSRLRVRTIRDPSTNPTTIFLLSELTARLIKGEPKRIPCSTCIVCKLCTCRRDVWSVMQ